MIAVTPSQFDRAASLVNKQEFLNLGQHCHEATCHQLDFLPYKCPACLHAYCQHHWRPDEGHACEKYDPVKFDNRIPSCPICHDPVPFKPGTDPNIAMDSHLSNTCRVLNPERSKRQQPSGSVPVCAERRCTKKLFSPIECPDCHASFCASHRYGKDHACSGTTTSTSKSTQQSSKGGLFAGMKAGSTSAPTASSGLAALRRAQQQVLKSTSTNDEASPAAESSSSSNPIMTALKTDRRAAQERASAKKALEARAKKGLLTEDEKVRYATLAALESKQGAKKSDRCILS